MAKPKIILLTAMHKRPKVSELFCMSANRLIEAAKDKYTIRVFSMVSDPESEEVCNRYGVNIIRTVDAPLGRKFNQGFEAALSAWHWDYLLQISDDDVVSDTLLDLYEPYIRGKCHYFGVKELYVLDSILWKALRFKYHYTTNKLVGCGRMFSRECIERTGWTQKIITGTLLKYNGVTLRPAEISRVPLYQAKYLHGMERACLVDGPEFRLYRDEQIRSMDSVSEFNLLFNNYHPEVVETPMPVFTDVKSTVNIWDYESFRPLSTKVTPEEAMHFWSSQEVEYVKTLIPPRS